MPKKPSKEATQPNKQKTKLQTANVISVDDVIKSMLNLFDRLGIDSSHLIHRVSKLATKKTRRKRFYPHAAEIGEILAKWHQDPGYLDTLGNPGAIRRRGEKPSFERLANDTVPQLNSNELLSELRRIKAVANDPHKMLRVQTRSVPVYEDRGLAILYTLNALHGFINTLDHNLSSTPSNADQLFHRIASHAEFNVKDLPALKIRVKRQGQSFLESCDNWMSQSAEQRTRSRGGKLFQVSIGVYLSIGKK